MPIYKKIEKTHKFQRKDGKITTLQSISSGELIDLKKISVKTFLTKYGELTLEQFLKNHRFIGSPVFFKDYLDIHHQQKIKELLKTSPNFLKFFK